MTATRGHRTLTARWVFPVAGPPLARGVVTVEGDRIAAVEPHGARTADEDLGNVAIVPGLVNAHTHLDLSGARGLIPPTDPDHFTDWLRGVIAYRRTRTPEQVQADIRAGLAECLRFGTTLIGDIASEGASWDAVAAAPTRAVVFWELIGLSEERFQAATEQAVFTAGLRWRVLTDSGAVPRETWRFAFSPHAPYSVNHSKALELARRGFTAVHLAESPGELELLATKTGPFVEFLEDLGVWNPEAITAKLTDFLVSHKNDTPQPLFVHCNYLPPDAPFKPHQTVVYCPRTHGAFLHPPHPFREFLKRGVRVCLGTDSLASNPDLDILAEARFVHARHPDVPGEPLLKMITLAGAEALGFAAEAGSLEVGKSADLVAVPLPDRDAADPHELLFADHPGDRRTMFRGEWRV
ncbi:amidohydrolase : Amidohydrolase OS=Isosphaera pallida (strain ATCC 43644 / DSM 9630 / IS1B) GN=Isop_1172 PE=4 SV=1: Amidohydro_1 [Gemmataceae bacterium]|nr:amidohydrolase : Amidohydrolase OS=Isosphaera pallida (strain ATCC 43644 / DSM 9630 / IS1B) GN=Isop_1172 PE=4 SV=1: Amidohydro_1 [Gemmataceae bacterium]VTT98020.1 amidohydrolase : Amidohydrolase OS=Isosphaera pallida (strain ATCC 43644 / DSM 9630 / IS1B) GN=Isop_1172 PE=4 SV=1: Amidohydro_1 [Gemmataceae bacterium]